MVLSVVSAGGKIDKKDNLVRYCDFKVYDPAYVALELGLFEKHGITVELSGGNLGGTSAIQAVSSGRYNAGLAAIPALINANAAGLPVIGVTDIQSALKGQPLEFYFVKNDSDIKKIEDLPGRKFAVNMFNASFHYTAIMALASKGVPVDAPKFVTLSFANQVVAMQEGAIEVASLMEPYATYLNGQGGYRVLFNANDVFGTKQFSLHFVNRIWAKENPTKAKAFVDAIVDAIYWIEENQDEAKAIMAKHIGIEEKYIPTYHFQKNGAVVDDDVTFWISEMKKLGHLNADWVNKEDVATNKYNARAFK